MTQPRLSVIIPTYNRRQNLARTLDYLARQEISFDELQVIVADNGSTDGTSQLGSKTYPFSLTILEMSNVGATQARNYGAQHSQAELLIFLDDDICLLPDTLILLADRCEAFGQTIVLGSLRLPAEIIEKSIFARVLFDEKKTSKEDRYIHYTFCKTGLLAIRSEDFRNLGGFQDPTGGWPNWDDVDFGYRAHLKGFGFLECDSAVGEHWDYSMISLKLAYIRAYRASQSAVALFEKHPALKHEIPMFRDALPLKVRQDNVILTIRKLARQVFSRPVFLRLLEWVIECLEKFAPAPGLLRPLYRWIIGSYIYRGFSLGQQRELTAE